MPKIKFTKSVIDQLQPKGKRYQVWDQEVKHFGLRVYPTGSKSFILKYVNSDGVQKYQTIGQYGSWTLKRARDKATRLNGEIAAGDDPQLKKRSKAKEMTVAGLCEFYWKEGLGQKKPSTLATDRGRIDRLIIPMLGRKRVGNVTKKDIEQFRDLVTMHRIPNNSPAGKSGKLKYGGKGTASRTIGLLGAIFQFAVDAELLNRNPVRGVKRQPDEKNLRYLSEEELVNVSISLKNAANEGRNIFAIVAIRLLILTGCRLGEVLNLRWCDVHLEEKYFDIVDGKTGARKCFLSEVAIHEFGNIPRIHNCELVFPGSKLDRPYQGLGKFWKAICADASIEHARLHDLRHTYASHAVSNGIPLHVVGTLLGHKDPATTQRYAHVLDNVQEKATEQVGDQLSKFIK